MPCHRRISSAEYASPAAHNMKIAGKVLSIGPGRVYSRAMAGVSNLTAARRARAYSRGDLSPVEAAREILERIEAREPRINAMYRVHRDAAIAQARAAGRGGRGSGA